MTIKYKESAVTTMVVDDVLCNRCGKSCLSEINIYERLHFEETWGYGSNKDMEKWTGDLCESCADAFEKWLNEFGGKIDKEEDTSLYD